MPVSTTVTGKVTAIPAPVLAIFITTADEKTLAVSNLLTKFSDAEYKLEGKRRSYEGLESRKAKYESDLAQADSNITSTNTVIAALGAGTPEAQPFEDALIKYQYQKDQAEINLRKYGGPSIIQAYYELIAENAAALKLAEGHDAVEALTV